MSRQCTYESQLLIKAEQYINKFSNGSMKKRLSLLEATAAKYSGADVFGYWEINGFDSIDIDEKIIENLINAIRESTIPIPLAIAALAREPLPIGEQRKQGAFYTDFRLAKLLASNCEKILTKNSSVADFAAGTGILLIALAISYKKMYPSTFAKWLSMYVYGYDLSSLAIRGAMAAFLSMQKDENIILKLRKNWMCCDSLLEIDEQAVQFDIIVGNPPWGKVKLSRHAFLTRNGIDEVYGSSYAIIDKKAFDENKEVLKKYSFKIKEKYDLLGSGEVDLYMAFLQKAVYRVKKAGYIFMFIPAGLIRSKGTEKLRAHLINTGSDLSYKLLDNKSKFFTIDTRFKFLLLSYRKSQSKQKLTTFSFQMIQFVDQKIISSENVSFNVNELKKIRKDLTVPELQSEEEKQLLFKIYRNSRLWGIHDDEWKAEISREVDMTNNKELFSKEKLPGYIPVIEGRMIQQYRFGAKSYVSGNGRSAKWIPNNSGKCIPQFYCKKKGLSLSTNNRIKKIRVGFCDIAGQKNERAMMCSLIPPNVVCGNKVPTIVFSNAANEDLYYLWISIANSFVFDWIIRRVISTTINFFLLLSVPIPKIKLNSEQAYQLIFLSKRLCSMNHLYYQSYEMSECRATIEAIVAKAYGLNFREFEHIFKDFPLIDRGQKAIRKEKKSTVSKDFCLYKFAQLQSLDYKELIQRIEEEKRIKAYPFIPYEMYDLSNMK